MKFNFGVKKHRTTILEPDANISHIPGLDNVYNLISYFFSKFTQLLFVLETGKRFSGSFLHNNCACAQGVCGSCAANDPSVLTITEKAPTRAFSWMKASSSAFTFKTLLRHYAKQALTPWSLNVKMGPRRNYHKGRVV